MRKVLTGVLAAVMLGAAPVAGLAETGLYQVVGVDEDDMLKMRAGPGVGYKVLLGLPNGAVVRVQSCEQTGSTRWCRVTLRDWRGVRGYVSWGYLAEM